MKPQTSYHDLFYTPFDSEGKTICHFYDNGRVYYNVSSGGSLMPSDSGASEWTFDIYDINMGYFYEKSQIIKREDNKNLQENNFYCNTSGGWGQKISYTNKFEYAHNHQVYLLQSLLIIAILIAVPLTFMRKFWRKV